jgi:deoxyribose-phosphate aldolase
LSKVDHTLLNPACTGAEIETLCREAVEFHTASVCVPPAYVRAAAEYLSGRVPVCTVIGFPNGYDTTASKVFQAKDAITSGADEIDMVIHIGAVKDGKYDAVADEIAAVKEACDGRILKVIVETALLTREEKIALCRVVTESGADFIKTSTGFAGGGATFEDVLLFKERLGPDVKIKASGGIATLEDAAAFIRLGCARLGASRLVAQARARKGDAV